jgi:methyl-accepting chemotaxis protein
MGKSSLIKQLIRNWRIHMNTLNNVKLGAKLFMGFGLVLFLASAVSVYGLFQMNRLAGLTEDMYNHPLQVTRAVLTADAAIIAMHRDMKDVVLASTDAQLDAAVTQVDTNEARVYAQLDIVEEWILGEEGLALLKETRQVFAEWKPIRDEVIALTGTDQAEAGIIITKTTGADHVALLNNQMGKLRDYAASKALEMLKNAQATRSSVIITSTVAISVAVLAGILIAYFLLRSITKPLDQGVAMMQAMAKGDIGMRLKMEGRTDEIGILTHAMDQVAETLSASMVEVSEAVGQLGSSASEILASTTQVAASTAESATSINETTTTVEEVRQAAQLSSQKAQDVSSNAQRVVQVSESGQNSVDETSAGMDRIREQMETIAQTVMRLSEQSQSIGGIIASVTDLADQSNLLAVNAAIEAAKAGEQGKGFAVVAQEIKSLAEQSKQATAQVRSILSDVQKATGNAVMATEQGSKAVEAGVKQAAQAGEAIRVLAETSSEAVQATTQIVASSQQQVVGMDQIGVAMENINQAGAQNAAGVHQMEISVRNLNELGEKLKELVAQFKV